MFIKKRSSPSFHCIIVRCNELLDTEITYNFTITYRRPPLMFLSIQRPIFLYETITEKEKKETLTKSQNGSTKGYPLFVGRSLRHHIINREEEKTENGSSESIQRMVDFIEVLRLWLIV